MRYLLKAPLLGQLNPRALRVIQLQEAPARGSDVIMDFFHYCTLCLSGSCTIVVINGLGYNVTKTPITHYTKESKVVLAGDVAQCVGGSCSPQCSTYRG